MGSRYPAHPGAWGHKAGPSSELVAPGLCWHPWGGVKVWCAGATSLAPCLQVHGQKAAWEDPVEWVRDTLPWPSAQQDQSKLYHLPPPTIGPHSTVSPPEERTVKDTTPSSLDADPLVWLLCAGEGVGGAGGGRAARS